MGISEIISKIDDIMWGPAMIAFLLGTGIYMTFKTSFVQRYTFKGINISIRKDGSNKGELSIFGALMTALSSTIGTGNIIGVGTAVVAGGPGAVFWIWMGGLFGIATKYAETYIAVKYRKKDKEGKYIGGAMIAFEKLQKPIMAKLYAIFCAIAAFGIGCATQSGAIADSLMDNFGISTYITGIVLCILTALVVFGGVKSIARVCEKLVPIMGIVYVIGCLIILIINGKYLPQTFSVIIQSAFTGKAIMGGFAGLTIRQVMSAGISRGLFSNEAGMGSAPQASAAGVAKNAVKPALVGSTGVFWDTIIICLMTGLVLISSIIGNDSISLADGSIQTGALLVSKVFGQISYIGTPLLIFGILTFAYSTILGWSYYGENAVRYLFGNKAIIPYRVLWIIVIFLGVVITEGTVWKVADILNAAMCIPNCILIWMLKDQILSDKKYYLDEDRLEEEDKSLE